MADTAPSAKLTFEGAQKLLSAAIAKAREIGVPQCICIVDSGGHLRSFHLLRTLASRFDVRVVAPARNGEREHRRCGAFGFIRVVHGAIGCVPHFVSVELASL